MKTITENNYSTLREYLNQLLGVESNIEFFKRNYDKVVTGFYIKFDSGESIDICGSLSKEAKEYIFNQIIKSKEAKQLEIIKKVELILSGKTIIK